MAVKSFSDSSIVRLSVASSSAKNKAEAGTYTFTNVPFTSESFKVSKESKMSTAILGNRRPTDSRNIKGSASGGFSFEVGLNPFFVSTVLPSALMNSYVSQDSTSDIGTPVLSNKSSYVVVNGTTITGYESTVNTIKVVKSVDDSSVIAYASARSVTDYATAITNKVDGTYFCVTSTSDNIQEGAQTVATDSISFAKASLFDTTATSATITFTVKLVTISGGVVGEEKTSTVVQTIKPLTKSDTVDEDKIAFLTPTDLVIGVAKSATSPTVSFAGAVKSISNKSTPNFFTLTTPFTLSVEQKVGTELKAISITQPISNSINLTDLAIDANATKLVVSLKLGTVVYDVVEVPIIKNSLLNRYLIDGVTLKPWIVEKYELGQDTSGYSHYIGQYFGTCVNELSLDFAGGDFVKASVTTMSTSYDSYTPNTTSSTRVESSDIATEYKDATQDALLDTTNSIKAITLKTSSGASIPAVFSTASLKISNNLREQAALGSEFMEGIGVGKVNVTLTGEIYFYDNTLLEKHLNNEKVSAVIELEDSNEALTITLPRLAVAAPTNNAQGENQDYKTSLTFTAEKGVATTEKGTDLDCVILVEYKYK